MRETRPGQRQFTQQLLLDDLLYRQCIAVVEAWERDSQLDTGFLDGCQNFVALVQRRRDHLFGKNMFPSLSSRNHDITMQVGGSIDNHGINIGLREKFVQLLVEVDSQGCSLCTSPLRVLIP